jgi:hypothetical protein
VTYILTTIQVAVFIAEIAKNGMFSTSSFRQLTLTLRSHFDRIAHRNSPPI